MPHTHTMVGSLTSMPAQPLLSPAIATFFKTAVAEGAPVIYVSFGSGAGYSQMLLPEDYHVMSRAFARMAPAKVRRIAFLMSKNGAQHVPARCVVLF